MTVTARTPLYLKPRMRPLPPPRGGMCPNTTAQRWWCTWPDGSIGFGVTERAAFCIAKEASAFKDMLHRRIGQEWPYQVAP